VSLPVQPLPTGAASRPAAGAVSTAPPVAPVAPGPASKRDGAPASLRSGAAARDHIVPLTAKAPTDQQLKTLLERWLAAKAAVLAGGSPPPELALIARDAPLERLREERRDDEAAGQKQQIEVVVDDLRVIDRTDGRLEVEAHLTYSDKRRDATGSVLSTTPRQTLRNVYVFGRDGGRWRLAATRSGG
jgi:hypothetical protein